MSDSQLTIADIADRLGWRPSSVRAYVARGRLPEPAGWLGRTPWWRPEDIDAWIQKRSK